MAVSHGVIVIVAICSLLSVKTHSQDLLNEARRWFVAQRKQEFKVNVIVQKAQKHRPVNSQPEDGFEPPPQNKKQPKG